jgi:hypothetical protein
MKLSRVRKAPHVVDHERHRQAAKRALELDQVFGVEVQDEMPSQQLQALDRALEEAHVGPAAEVAHEIEAHCANTALVHALEVAV